MDDQVRLDLSSSGQGLEANSCINGNDIFKFHKIWKTDQISDYYLPKGSGPFI
jgi:hypothetical protein